ncbi:MAG: hypothetical protein ACI4UK_07905 [Floccifex sp.]
MRKSKMYNILFIIVSALVCFVLASYLGVLPFATLPTMDFNVTLVGQIDIFRGNMLWDYSLTDTMYPFGAELNEGFSIYFLAKVFNFMGFSALNSATMTYFLLFGIGFFSMVYVMYNISKNSIVSIVLTIAYYINPIVNMNSGIPQMYFGIMLMPLQIMVDMLLLQYLKRDIKIVSKKSFAIITWSFIARLLMVSAGWYTAVISAVLSCFFYLLYFLFLKKEVQRRIVEYSIYIIAPWFLSMLLIMLQMPKGTSDFSYKTEFLYAASVDLIALFLPTESFMISGVIPFLKNYIAKNDYLFVGGQGIEYCYLGFGFVIATIVIILCNNKKEEREKKYLIMTAIVLLILALGPGLRIGEFVPEQDVTGYASYFLEKDKVISLPWRFVYNIFPLKSMRTVYRWFLGTRIAGFLMIALVFRDITLKETIKSYRKIFKTCMAYLLVFLCLYENVPTYAIDALTSTAKYDAYNVVENIYPHDICEELKNVIKKENALVAVCTYDYSNNGTLIPFLVSGMNIRTYAGCGDKAIALAQPYCPQSVSQLQTRVSPEEMIEAINKVNNQGLCDYIIMPYFSMRDAGYKWPAPTEMQERLIAICDEVENGLGSSYSIFRTSHYMVIDLTEERERISFDINTSNTALSVVKDDNFGDDRYSISLSEGDAKLNIESEGKDKLYLLGYVKSQKETVDFSVCAYDQGGEVIAQINESIESTGGYVKYEREFDLSENVSNIIVRVFSADKKAVLDSLHATVY